jgi:hypothetical protein
VSASAPVPDFAHEGWERRFVTAPDRLFEQVALYNSLGYEVRLEPVAPEELRDECSGCLAALTLYHVLYTRKVP